MPVLGEVESPDYRGRRRLPDHLVWPVVVVAYDQGDADDQRVEQDEQVVLLSPGPSRAVGDHLRDSRDQAASTHDDHHHHHRRRHDPLGPALEANS